MRLKKIWLAGFLLCTGLGWATWPGNVARAQVPGPEKIVFTDQESRRIKGFEVLRYHLFIMNADGTGRTAITRGDGLEWEPALSPDGKRVAFAGMVSTTSKRADLFVCKVDGSERVQLTKHEDGDIVAGICWSPDGGKLVFATFQYGKNLQGRDLGHLFVIDADGKNLRKVGEGKSLMPSWSADGKKILSTRFDLKTKKGGLYLMNADGTNSSLLVADAVTGRFSPDGKKLAYILGAMKSKFGETNLHLANADGTGAVALTNKPGENTMTPQWSADSKRLYFPRLGPGGGGNPKMFVIDADGKNEREITPPNCYSCMLSIGVPPGNIGHLKIPSDEGKDEKK